MKRRLCIAIDGPAGSGKGTIGEQLAHRLNYVYVDTGVMYRAVTWLALQEGIDTADGPRLAQLARTADIEISRPTVEDGRQYTVTARRQDVTWSIRNAQVTRNVSRVAAHPEVRAVLIAQQRALAEPGGVVMDGRDIGRVVLPDADLKIYLTASLEERSRRRYEQLVERMGEQNPALPPMSEVMHDIEERDENDRENMRPADDAIIISTDSLSVQQVLDIIYRHLEALS